MKKILPLFFALAMGVSAWGANRDLLTPEPHRITDEAIAADIKVIQGLQDRLADLNNKGVPIASYHFAKAQAWLDFALDEYTINDRSRVVEEALHQALSLIEQLEAGKHDIGMDTPVIPTSEIVRSDLWTKAEDLKKRISPRCTGDKIAQLEVQLVWSGHENRELGWRHSKPYLQAAERLAREADEQMAACPPDPPGSVAAGIEPPSARIELAAAKIELTATKDTVGAVKTDPLPPKVEPAALAKVIPAEATPGPAAGRSAPAPVKPGTGGTDNVAESSATPSVPRVVTVLPAPAPPIKMECPEPISAAMIKAAEPLPDRIHFAFDSADISTASAAVLDRIAAAMKTEKTLRVVLYGHADQRGDLYYNMNLSRRRAANVRASLERAGIPAERISVAPLGKTQPLTKEKSVDAYARNRRVEFFFSVGPPQPLVHQQEDLQPERKSLWHEQEAGNPIEHL